MTQVFESTQIDNSESILTREYASMRLSSSGERHLVRISQDRVGGVRLDRTTIRMNLDVDSEAIGTICLARISDGHAVYDDQRQYRCGDVYMTAQPGAGFTAAIRDLDVHIAVFDPALLGEVAEPAPGVRGPVRLLDHVPVSAEAAALWWRTYSFVFTSTRAATPEMLSPIYEREATRLLVAATLAAFPTNALVDPTPADRNDAHPHTLRRATEFIESSAGHDITLSDIADAADVTTRAVQLAFRRHLGTTPTAYLRKVRLEQVRQALVAGNPDRTTVTTVAGRWGFSNLGRFAAQYRAEFGELPGQTLRR